MNNLNEDSHCVYMSQAEAEIHVQQVLAESQQSRAVAGQCKSKEQQFRTIRNSTTDILDYNSIIILEYEAKKIGSHAALAQFISLIGFDPLMRLSFKYRKKLCHRLGLPRMYIDELYEYLGESAVNKHMIRTHYMPAGTSANHVAQCNALLTLEELSLQSLSLSDVRGKSNALLNASAQPFIPGLVYHVLEQYDKQSEAGLSESSYFTNRWLPSHLM